MTSVLVYVEGPSDRAAMTELLRPLISHKAQHGTRIQFFEAPSGDKKASVIRKVPKRAVSILANDPDAIVVALPDLYPFNKEVPHENPIELDAAIQLEFENALKSRGLDNDHRYRMRFRTFCFKHDLEALILAAGEALALRLDIGKVEITWHVPVEDQNNSRPPKHVVQELFVQHGAKYKETADAPLILGLSDYERIAEACPQQFGPFVAFLKGL